MTAPTFPQELAAAGRLLYGPQWQAPLARDLGVSGRTVRFWLAGERTPSNADAVRARLRALLGLRAAQIAAYLDA